MPNAFSYTRFSSKTQSTGSSVDRQEALIQDYLARHPDTTYHPNLSFSDLGVSGFTGRHKEHDMGRLLAAIESGSIGDGWLCLVEAIDRVGRLEPLDMLTLLQQIIGAGVVLVTLEDQQEYSRQSIKDNTGLLFLLVGKLQQAWSYSDTLSRRLKASYQKRRKQATAGEVVKRRTPFYLDSQTGKLRHPHAEVAKAMFELYLAGQGERLLLRYAEKRLPPGTIQSHTTIMRMLKNKTALGYWDEALIYEPLVSEETFYRVQQTIATRKPRDRAQARTYGLAGLVFCGSCGNRMNTRKAKSRNLRIACSHYSRYGRETCGNTLSPSYDVIDWIRADVEAEALLRYSDTQDTQQNTAELVTILGKAQEKQDAIDNLVAVLEQVVSEAALRRLETLQAELEQLHCQKAVLSQTAPSGHKPDLNDLTERLMDATGPEQSRLLQTAGLRIVVFQCGRIEAEGRTYQYLGYSHRTRSYTLLDQDGGIIDYDPKQDN